MATCTHTRASALLLICTAVIAAWRQAAAVRPQLAEGTDCCRAESHQSLVNTLSNISIWFSEAAIEYTTIFGTALTLHRDGDVKDGDDDVDLIISPFYVPQVWWVLRRHGVYVEMSFEFMRISRSEEWAPLDMYVDRGNHAMVADRWDGLAFPRSMIYPPVLKKYTWGAQEFQIPLPANADEVAAMAYGKSWKVPTHNYTQKGDHTRASQNFQLASDALAERVMLLGWFAASLVIMCIFRSQQVQGGLGLTTPATIAVFFGYVGLFLATSFLTRTIRDSGPNPITLVWAVCAAKALASVVLYRAQDLTFRQMYDSILPLTTWASGGFSTWTGKYVGLALFFVVSDVLRLDFIQKAGPSAFHVLINFRVFFCMWIWQWLMQKQLHLLHWAGITAICAGCILKEMPSLRSDVALQSGAIGVLAELLAMMIVGSISMVYNEKMLKTAKLPINYQNIVLYTSGLFYISIGAFFAGATSSVLLAELHLLMQSTVLLQVAVFAALGIVTSHFLKLLSSVTKEVATGVEVIVSIPLDAMLFGAPFGLLEMKAGALVLIGVLAFASRPMTEVGGANKEHKIPSKGA